MKYLLSLLLLVPFLAFADVRIENSTKTCHHPVDQGNADLEYKPTCTEISPYQNADGSYTVSVEHTKHNVNRGAGLASGFDAADADGSWTIQTTCGATAGTYVDENGNTYSSADCVNRVTYKRTELPYRFDIEYFAVIRNAAANTTATQIDMAASAGASAAFR